LCPLYTRTIHLTRVLNCELTGTTVRGNRISNSNTYIVKLYKNMHRLVSTEKDYTITKKNDNINIDNVAMLVAYHWKNLSLVLKMHLSIIKLLITAI
jgi:hypothetical protein